jgi:rhomboid family GlyGly-CTERM serine protease
MATLRQKQPQGFAAAIIFLLLLLGCNFHLFTGGPPSALSYNHAAVLSGEWWRLLTHPLVHVSRYHFSLDVLAVAILWHLLPLSTLGKCGAALICGAASLAAALLFSPLIREIGLCGLSGIAHGLMVVCGGLALHFSAWPEDGENRRSALFGGVLCAVGLGKSIIEVWSGGAIFAGMHGGHLGMPVVEAHLGGALGGLLTLLLFSGRRSGEQIENNKCCEK